MKRPDIPPPAFGRPAPEAPGRLPGGLRVGLIVLAAGFLAGFAVLTESALLLAMALPVLVFIFVFNVCYRLPAKLLRLRPRLKEWLVATWLTAAWLGLGRLLIGSAMEEYGWILVPVGLGAFLGCVWAWSLAARLQIADQRHRLLLQLLGGASAILALAAGLTVFQVGLGNSRGLLLVALITPTLGSLLTVQITLEMQASQRQSGPDSERPGGGG